MQEEKYTTTPTCVGFIMDGNRRWAESRGLTSAEGHAHGYATFKNMIDAVHAVGIPHMVCYAFSTENWKRTEEEVGYLMHLLEHAVAEIYKTITQDGKRVVFRMVGDRSMLPKELVVAIERVEALEVPHPELTLWMAISYGGRAEIVAAANRAFEEGVRITEENFKNYLWTKDMPEPDLIIRTSGEVRMSNFLLWQSAYSELFFTDTLWPDFGTREFQSILEGYGKRSRRKGT